MKKQRSRRRRGPTLLRIAITEEVVLPAQAPAGSRFKGYEDIVVQDLDLRVRATRYRRERWTTSGETVSGAIPAGIVGGFGADLKRFILALRFGSIDARVITANKVHELGAVFQAYLSQNLRDPGVRVGYDPKEEAIIALDVPEEQFSKRDRQVIRAERSTPSRTWTPTRAFA